MPIILRVMTSLEVREIAATMPLKEEIRTKARLLLRSRELLVNLIRKELKVRYKNSILGFAWSMLNPMLYLVVFYFVFNVFLPSSVVDYHVYLLSGLLPWTFFSISLSHATVSIVGSPDLVKKTYFARELLPLAPVGAGLTHFFLQLLALVLFLLVTGNGSDGAPLLVPLALTAEIVLLIGVSFFFAASNVILRDAQHFLDLALLALFWLTPIVYPSAVALSQLEGYSILGIDAETLYLANPMTRIILAMQRGIYGLGETHDASLPTALIDRDLAWYVTGIGYAAFVGIFVLVAGWLVFNRFDRTFAEEL